MTQWNNRIIGHGEESPDQLLANPANFRRHPPHQASAMADILTEVGWVSEVVVNRATGHIVDGHLRVELALRNGAATIPVRYIDVSPAEERLILATHDPIAALAFTDHQTLGELLDTVNTNSEAITQLLTDLATAQANDAPAPISNPNSPTTFSLPVDEGQLATIRENLSRIMSQTGAVSPVDALIYALLSA